MSIDPDLRARLVEIGLATNDVGDPAETWRRLRERFGPRATLIDRYALEADLTGGSQIPHTLPHTFYLDLPRRRS